MDRTIDGLTDDEVRQISLLIETLDRSTLDFLQIDAGSVKVTISKGGAGLSSSQPAPLSSVAAAAATAPRAPSSPAATPPAATPAPSQPVDQQGTVVIPAPLMGRFYPQPEPGAPPFVTVGSEIEEDTVVGLIEVMKLFNTVQAGVRGTITEICAPAGEFLEYGTALFRVRLASAGAAKGASA